jgi:tetratricopeptide (TPR) repeat protein
VTRAAGEAASAGDSVNAARLWGRAVELAPNDMMLRRLHAEALSWSGDTNRALAIYDALLEETPESTLLLRARAAVKVRSGDNSGALADLQAAEERAPTAGGQVLLGDIHRWLGDRSESRRAYDRALAVDRMVAGAQDGLDELARTAVRDLPWDIDEGTITTWSAIDDNTGFQTGVLRMQHGTPLGLERRTILLAAAELREVQRDVTRVIGPRSVDIRGGDLGVAHRFGDLRTTARMGATSFSNASEIITWSAGLEWNPGTTMFSGSLSRRPAFETLRAGATLTNGGALSAVSAATTFSRRLGATSELWASGELVALSDQNQRSSVQLGLRRDIARGLSLFYAGGWLGFEDAAASYWSPRSYSLQGLGLEYRGAWRSGAYVRAQALDGFAWFSQDLPGGGVERGRAGQWQLSGETGWRRPRWEITLASALGREREGSYQASTGLLRLRYRW